MAKSRIFLFLLLSFITGVALRSFLPVPVFSIWLLFPCGVVFAILALACSKRNAAVLGFLLVVFAAGIFRFEQIENFRPQLDDLYGKLILVQGIVWDEPEASGAYERFKVKIIFLENQELKTPFYVLVVLKKYPTYVIGDELLIQGILKQPENFRGFDYVSYLSRDNIYATVSFPIVEKIGSGRGNKLKQILSKIKRSFEENLDAAIPEPHAAFIKGLTLGDRESLPNDLVENFKRTGTTHIVALSGYNITLIGRFFVNTLLALTVPFRVSFWIATSAIFLFVILTGASPSVVRAGIMGILVLVAQREGRLYHMTNALAFAGAVMIFQNPKILRFDAAFQLSFLATLGLIYLSPQIENFFDRMRPRSLPRPIDPDDEFSEVSPPKKEVPDRLRLFPLKRIFIESFAAQIMVLPLLIYLFGRISIISPITNLLVLIAVPYSMALGFLTGFLGFIWGPLARISGAANWVLLEYKIRLIEFFAKFPLAQIEFGPWIVVPVLIIYAWLLYYLLRRSA